MLLHANIWSDWEKRREWIEGMSDPPSKLRPFFGELKRRRVVRVAIVYAAVALAVIYAADVIFPGLLLPEWTISLVIALTLLGFPIALVLAWAFEVTPEGVKRTAPVAPSAGPPAEDSGARPTRADTTSIAVLPLANLSGDSQQEYFSDGMTEALITNLAKIHALKVISRTSAMHYKNSNKPLPEIAAELGVDVIVEGSVLRAGDRVRITAQLIHAPSDTHLWAESYERDLTDVLALQGEVARAIAHKIKVKLTPQEQTRLVGKQTVNPAAHEAYLKGRYFWNQRGPGLKKSLGCFQQALVHDGDHAPAYAGLADAYALLGFYGYLPPREAMPKAKEAARKALEIDENLVEAHASLGLVHTIFDWEYPAANRELRRALELNPSYGPAHYWYANLWLLWGRLEEAIAEVQRGLEYDPLSVYMQNFLGVVFLSAQKYPEASKQFQKALELDPSFFVARSALGVAHYFESRFEESVRELQKAIESSDRDQWPVAILGAVYAAVGDQSRARELLMELERRRQNEYVSALDIAKIYTYLDDTDKAFEWLEKAYEERSALLFTIDVHPFLPFDSLRSDSRFEDLLLRIGLGDHG